MQIVKRRNEEDDRPGRYLQHNPEKTNNGIHLKVDWCLYMVINQCAV